MEHGIWAARRSIPTKSTTSKDLPGFGNIMSDPHCKRHKVNYKAHIADSTRTAKQSISTSRVSP